MVSLWTKSHFSFLQGASSPEELVAQAAESGVTALALTDRNGLYGVVRAHRAALELGVKLIIGAELPVSATSQVVLLAADAPGYAKLCQLITLAHVDQPKGQALLPLDALCAALAGDDGELLCLCPHGELLPRLARAALGRERVFGLCARAHEEHEPDGEAHLVRYAQAAGVPIVAAIEVLYHQPQRRALQDVLTCIRHGTTLKEAGLLLRPNAEHALCAPAAWAARFADRPAWLAAAQAVADRCTFSLSALRYRYPASRLPPGVDARSHLRNRVFAGAHGRYGHSLPAAVVQQLERELTVITELDYGGYFLSMEEIVLYCREHDILCQGRGSAANSMVCYCLGITAVDPAQMELLFERFLSRARAEPPDIDLDIEHHRREQVIQWVYAHYGRRHAAMVANVVRFRLRSALRAVGGALDLSPQALDALARQVGHATGGSATAGEGFVEPVAWGPWLAQAGLDGADPTVQHLVRLSTALLDVPRHLSVHPGGFVLGEAPVDTLCAVEPATMEGRTVVQWDKQDIEDMGLFKVDLLGLGALSHIHQAFEWIARTEHKTLTMATVPQEDPQTYAMIQRGDTLGVFQIESRAQMAMLPRLKPKTFYDLVVEVAIVRPGPIQGDMVHPYLRARQQEARPSYPHPAFAAILDKTYGVPIFQEQVMRLAILAADYSPDEADLLRRDMAAWRSQGRLEAHHARIVTGMQHKGVPQAFAERIFAQIRGFGEYGFPESHAASFAHIVYITAYLRCRHKEAFTCGLLNAQPMGFYSPSTIVDDARRRGVRVLPIRLGVSGWDCEVVQDGADPHRLAVRMGLRYVRGLGARERHVLAQVGASVSSLEEVARLPLHAGALCALGRAGALDGLLLDAGAPSAADCSSSSRRALLAQLRRLMVGRRDSLLPGAEGQGAEGTDRGGTQAPRANAMAALPWQAPQDAGESILWERRNSGHSTQGHPLAAYRHRLSHRGVQTAVDIARAPHGAQVAHGGLPICLQRPQTAGGVTFLTLEDETGFVNIVIWLDVFDRYAALIKTAPLLLVQGEVQRAGQVVHLVARHFQAPRGL